MQYAIVALLAIATVAYGSGPDWNNLRVTWNINPFSKYAFTAMPRDLSGSLSGFELRDDQCTVPNAKFLGKRYWYKKDPALSLLYDVNGIIAGIQTSMLKSNYTPPAYAINRNYIDDGDYYTLTAYFVDPSTICNGGRTADQLKSQGTGSGLWLQNGPDPIKDSVMIPMLEQDAIKTPWKFGHCFRTMGNHYWYNVTKDMSCDHFVPDCLMYNKGKLTAFCFAINAPLTSPRYEHPTTDILAKFIDPVPDCFYSDPSYQKLSTMHIYFIDDARLGSWC
jgi:charged multivesicular body protein 7